MALRFDDAAKPLPRQSSAPRGGVVLVMAVFAVAIALWGWFMLQTLATPLPASGSAMSNAGASSVNALPATYPVEFLHAAVAISTFLAPTPTPADPTPTYTMLGTPKPPDVCGTYTPKGAICTQPAPPAPTATPIPPCPVRTKQECVHPGGAVRWLPTPTPTLGSSTTSSSSS